MPILYLLLKKYFHLTLVLIYLLLLLMFHYIQHLLLKFLNYQMNLKFLMNLRFPHRFFFLILRLLNSIQPLD